MFCPDIRRKQLIRRREITLMSSTEEAKQAGVGRGSNKKQGGLYSREKKLIQRGAWGEKNKKIWEKGVDPQDFRIAR